MTDQTAALAAREGQAAEIAAAHMPNLHHVQQQVFLLEDTVMTMSMAVTSISQAMRRWEKVLLPMMVGFILLASYGFYLIYHLTYDIGIMTNNMAQIAITVDKNMTIIAQELRGIQKQMDIVTQEVVSMDDHLSRINDTMTSMNTGMSQIAMSTNRMGTDLWDLNRSISGPMSAMNKWAHWSAMGGRKEPPPPPQAVHPSVYQQLYGMPPVNVTPENATNK
jgi:hypothetical protein